MSINGAQLNELLISIATGGILCEYSAPPDNVGWFKANGDLIDYPSRDELNALIEAGLVRPEQTSGSQGGKFTKFDLTEKGSRFVNARQNQTTNPGDSFWTIAVNHNGATEVFIHVGINLPDLTSIIPTSIRVTKIEIERHNLDEVPFDSLRATKQE